MTVSFLYQSETCSLYEKTVDKLIVFCVYFDDNRDNGINRNNRINEGNEGNGGCHEVR